MNGLTIGTDGIQIGETWVPYRSIIQITTDKGQAEQTIVFQSGGDRRAFRLKLPTETFQEFLDRCKQANPACYYQSYRHGSQLAMGYVLLTLATVLAITGAIVAFFRRGHTLGWALMAVGLCSMLANIFVGAAYRRMKQNNGNDPKKMARAEAAAAAYEQERGA